MGNSDVDTETAHLFESLKRPDKFRSTATEGALSQSIKEGVVTALRDGEERLQFLLRPWRNTQNQR
jgi:hypothetical protein